TASASPGSRPRFVRCPMSVPMTAFQEGSVDKFQVDLRFGRFVLHQTDLLLKDGDLTVPLTRTYTSEFWFHPTRSHAFGINSVHDFDVGLVGSRNPYTYLIMVLPDGDGVYFPRVSQGGSYSDAGYQHSETSSVFYKATIRWDGKGWESKRPDGAT